MRVARLAVWRLTQRFVLRNSPPVAKQAGAITKHREAGNGSQATRLVVLGWAFFDGSRCVWAWPHNTFLGSLLARPVYARSPIRPLEIPIHFVESGAIANVASAWLCQARQVLERPLADRGMLVSQGPGLRPAAINLASAASLSSLWLPYFRSFMVAVRSDPAQATQCDWEIVPTGLEVPGAKRSIIAPWTSANTLARSTKRAGQVANLAFVSIAAAPSRWREASAAVEQLARIGVACRIAPTPLLDLSEIDVLVADCAELRQHGSSFLSPLLTAWRAGIPAILIDTESERIERTSALDYLPISSAERLVETVAQLQSHPQLYEAMRQRAAERARELRDNLITRRWVETLVDLVAPVAAPILQQRRASPVRALSLQAGRWLLQQGRRRTPRAPVTSAG
jgi:hypothetical protein